MTENEMVGWNHQINGHEFEQTPGVSEGQGSLVCCSPWDHRVRHSLVTEQQHILYMWLCVCVLYCTPLFARDGVGLCMKA